MSQETLIPVEQLTDLVITCPKCEKTTTFYPLDKNVPITIKCPNCPKEPHFFSGVPSLGGPNLFEGALLEFREFCESMERWGLKARFRYKAVNT